MTTTYDMLGYSVTGESVTEVVEEALINNRLSVVNTINPHSYVEAKSDDEFSNALLQSDKLIPDGSGIVFAVRNLHGKQINKIAGFDLFSETMSHLNASEGKVFFLGSTDEVLAKITKRATTDYPNVQIKTLSPPYKAVFSDSDIAGFVESINSFTPDVIFVGLTAPKQEKLIAKMRMEINAKMISGIGAVFDFYAGTVKRPSQIWIQLHLEWLVRLLGEPKRLWRRNFVSTPVFIIDVVKCKLRKGRK